MYLSDQAVVEYIHKSLFPTGFSGQKILGQIYDSDEHHA
jgi:hypothetical protein